MADDGGEKDVVAFMAPLAARSKDLVNTYGRFNEFTITQQSR